MSGVRISLPRPYFDRPSYELYAGQMRHHTKDKGDLGVGFVIADLMRHGIQVALPISEHLPFDCIGISADGYLARISVKYRETRQGRLEVRLRSSWSDKNGVHLREHRKSDYDVTAIYCPDKDCCYYVLNTEVNGKTIVLRTEPPKNNQVSGVRLAAEFSDPGRMFKSR